ncbi:MAG: hypothetical protein ASUL_06323 [Candidatus Aramenus sulfurataquae]|uniref:Uncharacterized protein n=2 Tax=Candidatus Aramenus sulfurataquae TaxID=1326980 RepID=W7KWS9_9CREN|nr:MAG: hypothetical protein ASUL_06323 [Candidatus Aramenus sulfurataquae]
MVFPALAVSGRVSTSTKNVFQVVRHGVIIKSNEGNYYYIGGKSNYWIQNRAFHAFQGTTEFTLKAEEGVHLFEAIRDAPSNIIVLQARTSRLSQAWEQPKPPEGCQTPFIGWIMDALEGGIGAGVIMNYLPYFLDEPIRNLKVGHRGLIYESGGKYTTDSFQGFLRTISKFPPLPFLGIIKSTPPPLGDKLPSPFPGFIYAPTPISIMNDLCQFLLAFSGEAQDDCSALVGNDNKIQQFSDSLDALIGAPIFTSLYCPSGCKNIGLAGLVYRGTSATIKGYGFLVFNFVKPPTDYSDAAIAEYANQLGVSNVLEISKRLVSSANKAEASIISALGLSAVVAGAIIAYLVTWYSDWQKTYNEARPYAEQAKAVIDKVRNKLNQMREYRLLSFVDECLAEVIEEGASPDEWYDATLSCLFEKGEHVAGGPVPGP